MAPGAKLPDQSREPCPHRRPAITLHPADIAPAPIVQPRARGAVRLSAKRLGARSVLHGLRQAGAFKALFPRDRAALQTILVNTAGGITGGDRFELEAHLGAETRVSLTTQAAERAYRAQSGETGLMRSRITVEDGAVLHWLPQELILYDGCALERSLRIDLAPSARLLMVEPVVFGRLAMGERVGRGRFRDRIEIDRAGAPLYRDRLDLTGDIAARLAGPACAGGAAAMASALYVGPDAHAHPAPLRAHLGATGGASLLAPDLLALRLVTPDSHLLRRALLPVLDRLSGDALPASWRL